MKTLALPLVLALAAAALSARPAQDPPPAAEPPALADVAWLAGHWQREGARGINEELWMPPRGGVMLGLHRTVETGQPARFEHLRLQEDADGVTYWASPSGAEPTPFRLTQAGEAHAVFENPEHDFPKRIEYRLTGDVLTASIAGDQPGPSFSWKKVSEVR